MQIWRTYSYKYKRLYVRQEACCFHTPTPKSHICWCPKIIYNFLSPNPPPFDSTYCVSHYYATLHAQTAKMLPTVIDVLWSVCVCLLYICTWPWALLKQLNQLRCHWNVDSGWHNKPCFIWGPGSPKVKGKFGGRLLQCSLSSKFFDCLCKPGDVPGPDQTWNNSRKGWLNKCRMRNQQLLNVFTYLLHWYVEVQWYTNQSHRVLTRRHNGSVSFLA